MGGPGCSHGVVRVRLARAPAALAIGPVHLDDRNLTGKHVAGESGTVAAGSFHADELKGPEAFEPAQQFPIARGRGGKALHTELGSSLVEGGRDVHIKVCVDPSGDSARDSGHCHLFLSLGWVTPHQQDDGQDSEGPVRQAPMRSLRPTGWCRVSVRARPTNRLEDSPNGRQPVLMESDLARAFTHTLASSPSGVVDRQRAISILAAGSEALSNGRRLLRANCHRPAASGIPRRTHLGVTNAVRTAPTQPVA